MRRRHCRRIHWLAARRILVGIHRGNARNIALGERFDVSSLRQAYGGEQFLPHGAPFVQILIPDGRFARARQHRVAAALLPLGLTVVSMSRGGSDASPCSDCEKRGRHDCIPNDASIQELAAMFQHNSFAGALMGAAGAAKLFEDMCETPRGSICSMPPSRPRRPHCVGDR
jgi:hypothetical protein